MHSLTALVDVPPPVVEEITASQGSRHANLQRFDMDEAVTILVHGEPANVIGHWKSDGYGITAFGSAVRNLSSASARDLLDSLLSSARLAENLSDLVLLITSEDGELVAATGNGSHRFFRRELPSGGTILSTQLRQVVVADSPTAVDRTYEDFFLGFGFHPDNRTMFAGVDQLPPLSVWSHHSGKLETLTLERNSTEMRFDTGYELIDLLLAAVARQSQGEDDCAVLLGGFDSALVCALLKELGKTVTSFTYDFGDDRFNQTNIDVVTDWLDMDHRWVPIDQDRMLSGFDRLPDLLNAPGAQPHYQLHTVFAAEDAADAGFDLALTGDGCDAIFLAYPTIKQRSILMDRMQGIPGPVGRSMLRILSLSPIDNALGHFARTGRSALRAAMLPYPAAGHLPTQYLDEISLERLRRGEGPPQDEEIEDIRIRLAAGLDSLPPAPVAFAGYSMTGASRIKVDGSVMHTGVAQATPFKDPAVARFVKELPQGSRRPRGSSVRGYGKQYLIDSVIDAGLLPSQVVLQEKQSPVTSPIDYWLMGVLREETLRQLEHLPFEWDRDYVENLLRPKRAEEWYRKRIALSPHALQAVGLLWSYASFARLSG